MFDKAITLFSLKTNTMIAVVINYQLIKTCKIINQPLNDSKLSASELLMNIRQKYLLNNIT